MSEVSIDPIDTRGMVAGCYATFISWNDHPDTAPITEFLDQQGVDYLPVLLDPERETWLGTRPSLDVPGYGTYVGREEIEVAVTHLNLGSAASMAAGL